MMSRNKVSATLSRTHFALNKYKSLLIRAKVTLALHLPINIS